MHVEDINVVRTELLERRFERNRHRLDVVASVVGFLGDGVIAPLMIHGILGENVQCTGNKWTTVSVLTLVAMTI